MRIEAAIKRVGRRAGLEISHYRPHAKRRARWLAEHGIRTVLDVGANVGQYAAELRAHGFSGNIISFEPVASVFAQLERAAVGDPKWKCLNFALGDADSEAEINIASHQASSSFLSIREDLRRAAPSTTYQRIETVQITTLDSLALEIDGPVLLKLDVQGYEDRVVSGCQKTLQLVTMIECELSTGLLYDKQASFEGMVMTFSRLGFRTIDLEPSFRDPSDGRVLSLDATLVRVGSGARADRSEP